MKYYLISYGYHYGNSGSASHATTVTSSTPIEFIKGKIEEGRHRRDPDLNQFYITFAMEITQKEYEDFHKRV